MARFGEDLIIEILVKLPVKSLSRFRCVYKSWFNLIKSPNFINMHLKHQSTKSNDCILIMHILEDRATSSLSFHSYESLSVISSHHLKIPQFDYFSFKVCGPCNGLLCISDGKTIALYNPAMREFKVLPPISYPSGGWEVYVEAIGFGFDSNTNDYKVVSFVQFYFFDEDYSNVAGIYNLSTNSWRGIERDYELASIPYSPVCGTLFNGAFHWIVRSNSIYRVLSFNMSTEVFWYLELPHDDRLPEYENCWHLTVLNESLALFTCAHPPGDTSKQLKFIDIWVMHEYGVAESWTKQFTIGPATRIDRPLLLWKKEAILVEIREGRLISFALDTLEMNDFGIHGYRKTLGAMVYQESLISIK